MHHKNPYVVLGISSSATDTEIKAAYKQQAFKYHPDRNKGAAYATERFKEVLEAYNILSDIDKKARYDRQSNLKLANNHKPAKHPSDQDIPNFNGPRSAYGAAGSGYDPLRPAPQPFFKPGKSYMGGGGRRYTYPTVHQVFIAVFLLACTAMGSIWMGRIMERRTAVSLLAQGQYSEALAMDSTYGQAWFALAEVQLKMGNYAMAATNVDKAIRLTNPAPEFWYWQRGRLKDAMGKSQEALQEYAAYLSRNKGKETDIYTDSCRYRLSYLYLQSSKQQAQAYLLLHNASKPAREQIPFKYLLGLAALQAGHAVESIALLQATADANYHRAESYLYLGYAFLATADTLDACKAWDIALINGQEEALVLQKKWCTFTSYTQN